MRSLSIAVGSLALIAVAVGCSQSTSGSSSGTAASAASGSGSGSSSGSSGSTGASPFVGQWEIATGNGSLTITGQNIDGGTQNITSSTTAAITTYWVTFSPGDNSSTLTSIDNQGCQLSWSVSGNSISLPANSSCTISLGGGCTETFSAKSGSVTFTSTDSMHLSGTGMLAGSVAASGSVVDGCTQVVDQLSGMGTATWVRGSGSGS